ncbi:MAG: glycoside hydrolase family 32 protein [Leeuwenhoekiella sp.]
MKRLILLSILAASLQACQVNKTEDSDKEEVANLSYSEKYRPQYHFSPEAHWMNDPNGLVFNKGIYHLFYQYYPEDIKWGPMHWGHATSKNLKDWQNKPVALYPDSLGYIFSGSAVVDLKNSSGFGTTDNPPLVAMFTYHNAEGEKAGDLNYQTQGIAHSTDNGDTWTKYKGNPVIANTDNQKDFRDPKLFWHEASQKWILVLVAGDHANIYNSTNLKDWQYLSDFGNDRGAHGGVWECPDLFELKANNGESRWVLFISINPGAPNGGSGTQYFIGDFDGKTFTSDQKEEKWLDLGRDNYAGITFNNLPEDERTFIGWMSNWDYGQQTPTEKWRSSMTLPRKLELFKDSTNYYVSNYPVEQITKDLNYFSPEQKDKQKLVFTDSLLQQSNLKFELPKPLADFKIIYSNSQGDSLKINYNKAENHFYLDRSKAGVDDFSDAFAQTIMQAPAHFKDDNTAEISIFTDQSSIEFFADGGSTVLTAQIFPHIPYNTFTIISNDEPKSIKLAHISSIWNKPNNQTIN